MVRCMTDDLKEETDFGFRRVPVAEKATLVAQVFDQVADRYDVMNDVMSVGVHRLWKRTLVDSLRPRRDMRLLDLAGGTGDIALRFLARARRDGIRWGEPQVTLCDINPAMLFRGRDRMFDQGVVDPVSWICGDAERLPLPSGSQDAVTIAFGIRNVTDIDAALREVRRVLRPGGQFLCLEFSRVIVPALEKLYDAYSFKVIPALGGLIAHDRESYAYLVESIRRFPDQETFAEMITDAGLSRVNIRNLSGGVAAIHSAWRT
jgi:demethylmenaquinone methyltransferase / 2-methoxy-6-polyprenyl-1,4-benzoquinol methylase